MRSKRFRECLVDSAEDASFAEFISEMKAAIPTAVIFLPGKIIE